MGAYSKIARTLGIPYEDRIEQEREIESVEQDLRGLSDTFMRIRTQDGRNLAMHRIMADSSWEAGRGFDHAYWLSRAGRAVGLPVGVDLPLDIHRRLNEILDRGDKLARRGGDPREVQQELSSFPNQAG